MRHLVLTIGIGALGCSSTASHSVSQLEASEDFGDTTSPSDSVSTSGTVHGSTTGAAGDTSGPESNSAEVSVTTGSGGSASSSGEPATGGTGGEDSQVVTESTSGGSGGVGGSDTTSTGGIGSSDGSGGSGGDVDPGTGGTSGETTDGSGGTGAEPEPEPLECPGLTIRRDCSSHRWRIYGDDKPDDAEACRIETTSHCPGAISFFIPAGHCLRLQYQGTALRDDCKPTTGSYAYGSSVDLERHFMVDEEWATKYRWEAHMWSDPTGLCNWMNAPALSKINSCANPSYGPCGELEDVLPPAECN